MVLLILQPTHINQIFNILFFLIVVIFGFLHLLLHAITSFISFNCLKAAIVPVEYDWPLIIFP